MQVPSQVFPQGGALAGSPQGTAGDSARWRHPPRPPPPALGRGLWTPHHPRNHQEPIRDVLGAAGLGRREPGRGGGSLRARQMMPAVGCGLHPGCRADAPTCGCSTCFSWHVAGFQETQVGTAWRLRVRAWTPTREAAPATDRPLRVWTPAPQAPFFSSGTWDSRYLCTSPWLLPARSSWVVGKPCLLRCCCARGVERCPPWELPADPQGRTEAACRGRCHSGSMCLGAPSAW